jgi:hypothetical protein
MEGSTNFDFYLMPYTKINYRYFIVFKIKVKIILELEENIVRCSSDFEHRKDLLNIKVAGCGDTHL